MKKLVLLLGLLLLGCTCYAESAVTEAVSAEVNGLNFNDNRASIALQKNPGVEEAQKQVVKNNWFCIVVQWVGEVPKKEETTKTE